MAEIDPRIPLMVQPPPQAANPMAMLEQFQNMAALNEQRQSLAQERQLRMQGEQRQQAEQAAIGQALQSTVDPDGNVDIDAASKLLVSKGMGSAAETLRTNHAKLVSSELDNRKKSADALSVDLKNLQGSASATNDQGSWDAWIKDVARAKGPAYANAVPKQFTPENKQSVMTWFNDADQQLKRQSLILDAIKEARETKNPDSALKGLSAISALPQDQFSQALSGWKQALPGELKYLGQGINSPEDAAKALITPEQRQQFTQAAAGQAETAARDAWTKTYQQKELALRQQESTLRATDAATSKNYNTVKTAIDKARAPLADKLGKVSELEEIVNQGTPQADALVAPKLLTVMAGGQGSGLRMNEAEISRIVGGRNNWQSLKARIDAWQADPSKPFSITPDQRKQIRDLVSAVKDKAQSSLTTVQDADEKLLNAGSVDEQRRILTGLQKTLETGPAAKGGDPLGIR